MDKNMKLTAMINSLLLTLVMLALTLGSADKGDTVGIVIGTLAVFFNFITTIRFYNIYKTEEK